MKNQYFVAWLLGVFALTAPLHAADNTIRTLEGTLPKLESLAKRIQDKKLSREVNEVLQYAKAVVLAKNSDNQEMVEQTLGKVQALTRWLKVNKLKMQAKKMYENSSGCDGCRELNDLESDVSKCCKEIDALLWQLLELLQAEFPCDAPIAISTVPYTIRQPGKYCVTKDLRYVGSGAAITVASDNVTLNFHNHSLTLTDQNAQGVVVTDVSEFTLLNDVIQGEQLFHTTTSVAVKLTNVQKATLENIYTYNTTKGIQIIDSTDVKVVGALVRYHEGSFGDSVTSQGAGVWVENSIGVWVDATTFEGAAIGEDPNTASNGIFIFGDSENVVVKDSTFRDWPISIYASQVTDLTIDHVEAVAAFFSNLCLCQFGDFNTEDELANNIIIRDSSFSQQNSVPGFDGLLFAQGSSAALENVIVHTASSTDDGYLPAAIHIGCANSSGCTPALAYDSIFATNCMVTGDNAFGLFIENGTNNTFTNSEFFGANFANVYILGFGEGSGAGGCQIRDSLIADAQDSESGSGVYIQNSFVNAVVNCEVVNNSVYGIFVDENSSANHIRGNRVFGSVFGIDNQGGNTETYYNTSCNNSNTNCINVSTPQVPSDIVLVGSNICCQIED